MQKTGLSNNGKNPFANNKHWNADETIYVAGICSFEYLWIFYDSSHRLYTIQPLYNPSGGDHFNISVKYEIQELFLAVELLNRVPEKMLKKM